MVHENETEETIINEQESTSTEGTQPEVESGGNSGQTEAQPQGKRHDNTVPYQKFAKVFPLRIRTKNGWIGAEED